MLVREAIEILQDMVVISEQSDTPTEAMLALHKYVDNSSKFNSEVHDTHTKGTATWLRAWGQSPATFMYKLAGGYENFLEYKYWLRRGRTDDIGALIAELMHEEFRDMPKGTEYEHNVNPSMTWLAEE